MLAVVKAMKETMEVREARRGDELDRFMTLRELVDSGIATLGLVLNRKRTITNPFFRNQDLTVPGVITGFTVTGGYASIILQWNRLTYDNHSHVEIWRSATDALGTALLIGQSAISFYTDTPGAGSRVFYYWVRAVSQAGVFGPYNAVHGTRGETALDVPYVLEQLVGQITASQLYIDLGARIDLIDAADTALNSVNARIKTLRDSTTGSVAQVNTRVDVLESVDLNLITAVNQIIVVDQGQASEIYLEQITRISADEAQAVQITSLTAQTANNTALITNEQTARASADEALTSNINAALSRIGVAESSITSNYTTLASADAAQAVALNTVTSSLAGNTSSISTQGSTINGLSAQYTVKIDNNGFVSGYGLASTAINGTPFSEFYIRADRFAIGSPGQTKIVPFIVNTGIEIINGVTVPPGVYMDAAYIKDGTITSAKIGVAAIDDAHIATLNAAKIIGGEISADVVDAQMLLAKLASLGTAWIDDAWISNTIQSTGFGGGTGWIIDKVGSIQSKAGNKRTVMDAGDVITYRTVSGVEYPYKSLTRVEFGTCTNGTNQILPGYFEERPKILVSPALLRLYDSAYSGQSQTIDCVTGDVTESSLGSGVWSFTPTARLILSANTSSATVNNTVSDSTNTWNSSTITTLANLTSLNVRVEIASTRGTGTAGTYAYRQVTSTVFYRIAGSGSAYTTGASKTTIIGAQLVAVTDYVAQTPLAANSYEFYVRYIASDASGTFSVGGATYDYGTDSRTFSGTASLNKTAGGTIGDGTFTASVSAPAYSPPSGWSVYQSNYSYTVDYFIRATNYSWGDYAFSIVSVAGTDVAEVNVFGSPLLSGGTSALTNTVAKTFTSGGFSPTLSMSVRLQTAPSSIFPGSGSDAQADATLSNGYAQILIRRPITNSTTPANAGTLASYTGNLATATVLAQGSVNWMAVGV